ncbi:cysteine proteinase COT44-like [Cucumis melo var. makuwa]|uniref:Cysteine proteinase COT44-like n=1 Tax=Cucumis melo var. makuwa TaxID=1194695 RepID=A0A5A7UNN9_CUCMM|nr:cysteine proteinase COT44-like [Cucumis melo var. makuwa]
MATATTSLALLSFFFLSISASALSRRSDGEVREIYDLWLAKHGKAYNGIDEREKRFQIFKENLNFIDDHNSENRTYKVGLNMFADLTNDEYRALYLGTRSPPARRVMKAKTASRRYAVNNRDRLPESVDWRARGAVAPVKNQGSCAIIRAFPSSAVFVAAHHRRNPRIDVRPSAIDVSLSFSSSLPPPAASPSSSRVPDADRTPRGAALFRRRCQVEKGFEPELGIETDPRTCFQSDPKTGSYLSFLEGGRGLTLKFMVPRQVHLGIALFTRVDLLSVDSIEGHNQVSGNVTASCSLCAIGCKELFTDRHRCPDVRLVVEGLSYVEEPVQILDRKEQVLRNKTIPLIKVLWRHHGAEEATWEPEYQMKTRYPILFS